MRGLKPPPELLNACVIDFSFVDPNGLRIIQERGRNGHPRSDKQDVDSLRKDTTRHTRLAPEPDHMRLTLTSLPGLPAPASWSRPSPNATAKTSTQGIVNQKHKVPFVASLFIIVHFLVKVCIGLLPHGIDDLQKKTTVK